MSPKQRISFIKAADAVIRTEYPKEHYRSLKWYLQNLNLNGERKTNLRALYEKARQAGCVAAKRV